MTFYDLVTKHITKKLAAEYLLDQIEYGLLRDTIEECFLLEGFDIPNHKKAEVLLSILFGNLVRGFDFTSFLNKLPQNEQSQFLTTFLYHIYYLNLKTEHLASKEMFYFYLTSLVAIDSESSTIGKIYTTLDLSERLRFLGFCITNFDEGSYRILQFAKNNDIDEVKKILTLLERKIIGRNRLSCTLDTACDVKIEELQQFLQTLQAETTASIKSIQKHLSCTEKELSYFCSIFGLYDHQVPKEIWDIHIYEALEDKLDKIPPEQTEFLDSIASHIHALSKTPEEYIKGADLITYALPTAAKDLSRFAWLPSITEALSAFCDVLKIPNTIPIFVFDQSHPELYKKNSAYIQSVTNNCIHLNSEDVISLAKVVGVENLLQTGANGQFGYGGARNAIFLLMPLYRHYLKACTAATLKKYVESLDDETIRKDFASIVLNESLAPCIIHMGDDDVHVPFSTIFSDALFACKHKDEYFCRFGWVKGRRTTWTETSFNLEYILEKTPQVLLQHSWQDKPFRHGMAGLLSKPKLCLNVPFGQEEAYLLAMKEYLFDLRHPMLHLCGYRLPKTQIPTNRFCGLAAHLKAHYTYSIGSMLVSDLLDPLNLYNRCSLPWNMVDKPFSSLKDAIDTIVDSGVIHKMQLKFAENRQYLAEGLKNYETNKFDKSTLALFHLGILEIQDVPALLCQYNRFTKECDQLSQLFLDLKNDAISFKKLLASNALAFAHAEHPITNALKLLIEVILNTTFQKNLLRFASKSKGIG